MQGLRYGGEKLILAKGMVLENIFHEMLPVLIFNYWTPNLNVKQNHNNILKCLLHFVHDSYHLILTALNKALCFVMRV